MEAALHAALEEGALGFSTSQVHTHNDGDGQPVPSRAAGRAEMERLAAAVRAHEGTTVELIVAGCLNGFTDEEIDFLATMSLLADRPGQLERARRLGHEPRRRLEPAGRGDGGRRARRHRRRAHAAPHHADPPELRARRHPRRPAGLARGVRAALRRAHGGVLGPRDPPAARRRRPVRRGRDPAAPRACGTGSSSRRRSPRRTPTLEGRTVGEVARRAGRRRRSTRCSTSWWPTACARACALPSASPRRTGCCGPRPGRTRAPSSGGSDAGAHLDTMCGAIYSTSMLGDGVRARGPAQLGAGGAPADRHPGPALRPARPGPPGARRLRRRRGVRPVHHRPRRRAHARRPARRGQPPLRRGDRHRPRARERDRDRPRRRVHRRGARRRCCARAATPTPCTPGRTGRGAAA